MLADDLKTLLATTFSFYLKATNFHWNIVSPDFPQYHAFLGDLYGNIYESVDPIAEYIRALNFYSPASLSRFSELTLITDQTEIIQPPSLFSVLLEDNTTYLTLLNACFNSATTEKQQGIANFLAERIDYHGKIAWQLRSILGVGKPQ
jgi:starvation-inducible DNA-binding protein